MKNLIKFSSKKDGSSLYINPLNVVSVWENKDKGGTEIAVFLREIPYLVSDSAEEVVRKIQRESNIINFNADQQFEIRKDNKGMEGGNS